MIISSQRYVDFDIVDQKISELDGMTEITLITWAVDDAMEILSDGHHTFEAANELGITVNFEKTTHPEGLSGNDLLEAAWMDSDWYDVETGTLAF